MSNTIESRQLEIGDAKGQVIVKHLIPNGDVVFSLHDGPAALEVADAVGKASYRATYGKPAPGVLVSLADQIIERKRRTLHARFMVMMNSMQSERRSLDVQATQLVDAALKELT